MNQEDASLEQPTKNIWVYFWAFYSVHSMYIFFFASVSHSPDYCSFIIKCFKLGSISPPNLFFFCKVVLPVLCIAM